MAIKAGQLKERADYQAYILEMLREENAYQAVSYTHLDVYKRQIYRCRTPDCGIVALC